MNDGRTGRQGPYWIFLYSVYGVAMVAQVCLLFLLPAGRIAWLRHVGWALFVVSAILGWLPILLFRRHGHVAKGKSYMHTTELVTSGLYAIVRHPQFLASDFLAVAVLCIAQHWGVYLAGGVGVGVNHLTMIKADHDLVEKFGEPYHKYKLLVPQWNFLIGLWSWVRQRRNDRLRW